ncbi:hypothetical protein ASG22_15115 [Chryseobacterium sp. Leaf405]|uniref:hypothetical protein n=1 Tax=Chryseobacterium sp. Leaf405 TaxID=1736367 RepID=UPI0006FA1F08|nr:hypothetical protein [Chryseobacterium sp. Leaf405]KQT22584.1 hypothetical protein ASG22_15115 [Chryseobacterium sp. Leaf405]
MKKIYLLLPLFSINCFFSQNSQLYYSGRFLDAKNKPKNFLKIFNKNSGIYELTDEKGFAIIAAKDFDTLVWNNGKNKEVVRNYNLRELKDILQSQVPQHYVKNIYSKSYDSLISKKDTDVYSIENSKIGLDKKSAKYFDKVKNIRQKNDTVYRIKQINRRNLNFNGIFTTSFDIKQRNAIPKTQNKYVQGRSENGSLVWKSPETDEMFSFGPNISTLGFDNLPYDYDQNGRLVTISNGISPAKAYRNDLFKTTVSYNNQLKINAIVKEDYQEIFRFSLDLGQQKDQMYFEDQFNINNFFKARFSKSFKGYSVNLAYNYEENKATNSNRIGLFNRVYQNSLLTPVSFSNSQGSQLSNGSQRSYSRFADNPSFLYDQENKYHQLNFRRQFSFDAAKNFGDFKLNISQSYEDDYFWNFDYYKPSTYGFSNGLQNERTKNNSIYNSIISGNYSFGNYDFRSTVNLNFIINDRKSDVFNSLTNRRNTYQRTSQDYYFNYNLEINKNDLKIGADVANSFYISNTSLKNQYWLPKANAYIIFEDIFNWSRQHNFKILGAYTELSSEPEITRSYASYATTLLNAQTSYQYFPVMEAETFKNLSNINIKELKTGFKWDLGYRITLEGEYFKKKIFNDIFPIYENNQLRLKNLADHTYSGYEFNFSYRIPVNQNLRFENKISFFNYRDIVDRVEKGYNNLPISGFNDIYKTLSEGQVLGAVMGSYFEKNNEGQLIIDEFGYPKKGDGMKIIADPTPDFVMKFNHNITFKRLTLDINWEWKKGGQLWNGTQAALDYYGRSQISADQRDSKNFVFEGVNSSGNTNQIPVDFYNPNQSVLQNKWTRYGYLGVAENYIQKADYVRINTISLSANLPVNQTRTSLVLTFYVNNILLWQAAKGTDPNQNFYDLENGKGLDFFNLPSFKTFGCMVSFKF